MPTTDGTPGDYLDADGLVDIKKFDAQGHRGGRGLRPENTLPAMEGAPARRSISSSRGIAT